MEITLYIGRNDKINVKVLGKGSSEPFFVIYLDENIKIFPQGFAEESVPFIIDLIEKLQFALEEMKDSIKKEETKDETVHASPSNS